jgi:holo-ACP synthase
MMRMVAAQFSAKLAAADVRHAQLPAVKQFRAACQAAALERFDAPLVSATIVMPGPVTNSVLPQSLLTEALREVQAMVGTRKWPILLREVMWSDTGPEAIYVVDVKPRLLKSATVELEDQHPLGRLWDLEVVAPGQRVLSRKLLGLPERRCLACERPASECGRARRHSLPELLDVMQRIVKRYDHTSPGS